MTKKIILVGSALLVLLVVVRLALPERHVARGSSSEAPATPEDLDRMLAPVALYPDQLLGQMLICAQNPGDVDALHLWMGKNPDLKGTELQDALADEGFESSLITLALFPQVVMMMAEQLDWTTDLGVAFTADRPAVFASIQRLRKQATDVGTLKSTSQQSVETRTTSTGESVIVIEPANPQVVYVPQYNTTTVYTQAPTSTTIIIEDDDDSAEALAAGMIGFTTGVVMGAAFSNPYYYGPYGWYGGAYMYNDAWDDYYDHREDAREDWMDHREDMVEERGDRVENNQGERTERQENRQENRPETDAQREQRRSDAQAERGQRDGAAPSQRDQRSGDGLGQRQQNTPAQTPAQSPTQTNRATATSAESRGYTQRQSQPARDQSGRSSDAFSGYSSGRSERSASQRGSTSRGSSSGSRSRGSSGGGRRR